MNYPYNIGCCNNCGNLNNNSQKCSSCDEPEPTSSKHDPDCIRRSNECYRPECNVTQVINGEKVTINAYEEVYRECRNKPSQCKGAATQAVARLTAMDVVTEEAFVKKHLEKVNKKNMEPSTCTIINVYDESYST